MLREYCHTSEEYDNQEDLFVGLKITDGQPSVFFPHGYNLSNDDNDIRRDIFGLLSVLRKFSDKNEGDSEFKIEGNVDSLPLEAFQYVIYDFLSNGYYQEKEVRYIESNKGKINWKRTIQNEKPEVNNGNFVYLNFQTRVNRINDNNMITLIHEFCVYKSFSNFGWLYLNSEYLPRKPRLNIKDDENKKYISIVKDALGNTFNDSKKKLFKSMIEILEYSYKSDSNSNVSIGVNKFEHTWEKLIDYVFGTENVDNYFPHGYWIYPSGSMYQSSSLMPDTIMRYDGKIFIIDAKYYRYKLPTTDSIQKQITYGKYNQRKYCKNDDGTFDNVVYNAFVLPYNCLQENGELFKFAGIGISDWEEYNKDSDNYLYVVALYVDTKYLITTYSKNHSSDIVALAEMIEKVLEDQKPIVNDKYKSIDNR